MDRAPIAFFAYNRPEHTLRALSSLADNAEAHESELFIFCDAPKKPEHQKAVDEVRRIVRSRDWCGSVHIREQHTNQGCARSIINGVTEVCNKYRKIIVIEDDLILSPNFLDYMNSALSLYESADRVMQISGYMFPVDLQIKTDALFLPFTTSWGWATWSRAWESFDPDMTGFNILNRDRELRLRFNINGAYDHFGMLEAQKAGRIDSWAIRWYLSTFLKNGLTLYPRITQVQNIGFDGSGTHRSPSCNPLSALPYFQVQSYPPEAKVSRTCTQHIEKYLEDIQNPHRSILTKIGTFLRKS